MIDTFTFVFEMFTVVALTASAIYANYKQYKAEQALEDANLYARTQEKWIDDIYDALIEKEVAGIDDILRERP